MTLKSNTKVINLQKKSKHVRSLIIYVSALQPIQVYNKSLQQSIPKLINVHKHEKLLSISTEMIVLSGF